MKYIKRITEEFDAGDFLADFDIDIPTIKRMNQILRKVIPSVFIINILSNGEWKEKISEHGDIVFEVIGNSSYDLTPYYDWKIVKDILKTGGPDYINVSWNFVFVYSSRIYDRNIKYHSISSSAVAMCTHPNFDFRIRYFSPFETVSGPNLDMEIHNTFDNIKSKQYHESSSEISKAITGVALLHDIRNEIEKDK